MWRIKHFILWVFVNFIEENWDEYTKIGKIFLYLPYLIQGSIIYLLSPLLIPYYIFIHSKWYRLMRRNYNLILNKLKDGR